MPIIKPLNVFLKEKITLQINADIPTHNFKNTIYIPSSPFNNSAVLPHSLQFLKICNPVLRPTIFHSKPSAVFLALVAPTITKHFCADVIGTKKYPNIS